MSSNITAFTSNRTNLSPFTKGCRDEGRANVANPIFGGSSDPNQIRVGVLGAEYSCPTVVLQLSYMLTCPRVRRHAGLRVYVARAEGSRFKVLYQPILRLNCLDPQQASRNVVTNIIIGATAV